LTSQLLRVIGHQFEIRAEFRSGLGIREINVLRQDKGGGAPERIELKRGRRIGISSSANVWYHSYGRPSGPGARRRGRARMAVASSSAVKGERRKETSVEEIRGREREERKEEQAEASNSGAAYT